MFWCLDRDGQRVAEWLQFRIDTCNTCTCVEGRREVEVAMTFRGICFTVCIEFNFSFLQHFSVMPRSQAFSINPVTGAVEVVGRVLAGSAFTLTVQVQGHHCIVDGIQGVY